MSRSAIESAHAQTSKKKRVLERPHQYRMIAERLQFHLDGENMPAKAAELVRTAREALISAADAVEESVTVEEPAGSRA